MATPSSQNVREIRSANPRDLGDELYGYLLKVNATIKDTNNLTFPLHVLLLIVVYFALWTERYRSIAALRNEELNHFFVYFLVFIFFFVTFGIHDEFLKKLRYRRIRRELCIRIRDSGKGRHQILAMIEGHTALSEISEQLKRDRMEVEFF